MRRIAWLAALSASVFLTPGCASTGGGASTRRSADDDPAELKSRLASVEAQLAADKAALDAARAELGTFRSRVQQLEQRNAELIAASEKRVTQPLERPRVSVSPLPPTADRALRELATTYAGRLTYDRPRAALSFANDRLFEPGGDVIRPDALVALRGLASVIATIPADEFDAVIIGHTDDAPIAREETRAQHPTNWHLSAHRAIAVKTALAQAGVPEARLAVMGYGPSRPAGASSEQNRRVEIFFVRKGQISSFEPVRASGESGEAQ